MAYNTQAEKDAAVAAAQSKADSANATLADAKGQLDAASKEQFRISSQVAATEQKIAKAQDALNNAQTPEQQEEAQASLNQLNTQYEIQSNAEYVADQKVLQATDTYQRASDEAAAAQTTLGRVENANVIEEAQTPEDAELVPAQTSPTELDEDVVEGTPDTSENLAGQVEQTLQQPTAQDLTNGDPTDWRVRLSLSPFGPEILYLDPNNFILAPLRGTNGVVFPYTPSITVNYNASYTPTAVTHSNYTIHNYVNSSVDNIAINCDFTAQDTNEANYLLAVIHFFKSATKMFYGQDGYPKPGTPPPLCFLTGLGQFQFSEHPLAITNFTYSLPTDVDYIRAIRNVNYSGKRVAVGSENPQSQQNSNPNNASPASSIMGRLSQGVVKGLGSVASEFLSNHKNLLPGGIISKNEGALGLGQGFQGAALAQTGDATYVPTKIQIQISAVPIISRYAISNRFSLGAYATGALTPRGFW